jgi:hypothetical protein
MGCETVHLWSPNSSCLRALPVYFLRSFSANVHVPNAPLLLEEMQQEDPKVLKSDGDHGRRELPTSDPEFLRAFGFFLLTFLLRSFPRA